MNREIFDMLIKNFNKSQRYSQFRDKLRKQIVEACELFNYSYYAREDLFIPNEGIDIFEFMILGTTPRGDESVLYKKTFIISEKVADQISCDFLVSDPSLIRYNIIHALSNGIESSDCRDEIASTIEKLIARKGGFTMDHLSKVVPPNDNLNLDEGIVKFRGEAHFSFETGTSYFSCFRVTKSTYEKIVQSEKENELSLFIKKTIPMRT